MASYRNISMDFWTDSKVVDDFTPEDRYIYLYCMTNPHTNLCGCYEVSIKQINLGFTAFAFETPFADAALAYRYVAGEDIPEDKVFCYGMSPMFGGWKETQDLLRWMREYNLSNKGEKPLHFYGVDIGSAAYGGNSAYPAVKAALDYLAAVDPGYSHGFAWLLETAETQDLFGFKALNPESQKRFLWEATRLYNRISYMGPHDAALTSAEAYQWALRSAYLAVFSARWFAGYAEAGCEDLSDNIRELCMAENIN